MKSIIIIGMHRSGTSLIASLLQQSGLDIGKDLMGAATGNDKGHFENMDFYTFHRQLLAKHHLNPDGWDETEIENIAPEDEDTARQLIANNQSALWGWKDPRTTLLLKFWAKLLPDACFLFIYRSPAEVIDSLYRRATDDLFVKQPEKCADTWLHYNQLILKYHQEFKNRTLVMNVQSFIHAYPECIAQLNKKFGTALTVSATTTFDQKLFHCNSETLRFRSQQLYALRPEIASVYRELVQAAWHPAKASWDQELLHMNSTGLVTGKSFFRQWRKSCSTSPGIIHFGNPGNRWRKLFPFPLFKF